MLVWQRILRVAVPAALLIAFVLWMASAPPREDAPAPTANGPAAFPGGAEMAQKPVDAQTQTLLEKTVADQLAAFNKKDYASALRFAASGIRQQTTADAFRDMVIDGFPEIAASEAAAYRAAVGGDNEAVMPVLVQGRDGARKRYLYVFVREDGAWRISAVLPNTPPARGPGRPSVPSSS